MSSFHSNIDIHGRTGECIAIYLEISRIIDRFEVLRACEFHGVTCTIDGILVDDIESPVWTIEKAAHRGEYGALTSLLTLITVECRSLAEQQIEWNASRYYQYLSDYPTCTSEYRFSIPVHLRYGASEIPEFAPSPILSLLCATLLCVFYLMATIKIEK